MNDEALEKVLRDLILSSRSVTPQISHEPTEITSEEIDCFVEKLRTEEIQEKKCSSCNKGFYFHSYGWAFSECDECYFARWPKKEREEFFRSFFE